MQVLTNNKWQDGYLEYNVESSQQLIIDVSVWINILSITNQYIVRERDWRLLWNYIRKIGFQSVISKIISRTNEAARNAKFASIGIGRILTPTSQYFNEEDWVMFLAYNHPACVSRIVIERQFIISWEFETNWIDSIQIQYYSDATQLDIPQSLYKYFGWSPFAGISLDTQTILADLRQISRQITSVFHDKQLKTPVLLPKAKSRQNTRLTPVANGIHKKNIACNGIIFGLGNYAKTAILPNLPPELQIVAIHEIDPTQIGTSNKWNASIDTGGTPRPDERYDVYFIAGYHHTHADIAIHALKQGAYAVIEKPIATTCDQLTRLRQVLQQESESRFFACFHKRYLPFNEWLYKDLGTHSSKPINYHCIVYEIPLPSLHWYNWPNSGSRIVSNGCHWIDHFLYLNRYSPMSRMDFQETKDRSINIFLELENGAVFSMLLTDVGSYRLGVRDYIEIRAGDVTVSMVDGAFYQAENHRKIVRRRRINPMNVYKKMYKKITHQIVSGMPGDSMQSLLSSEIVLSLEGELVSTRMDVSL